MKILNKTALTNPLIHFFLSSLLATGLMAQGTSKTSLTDQAKSSDVLSGFSMKLSYFDSANIEAQYLAPKMHLIFGLYPEQDSNYIAAPKFYYSSRTKLDDDSTELEYTIGRRQTVHNKLDDVFHLGVVNPYLTQDFINYTPEGLTGFHLNATRDIFTLTANFYPVFIPNQGPSHTVKNGKLVGVNRWAQSAPKTFIYDNKENNIDYRIADYKITDLMAHSGYSLAFKTGDLEKTQGEINVTYSDTPINDIVISRTVIADLNMNGSVEIFPVVRTSKKVTSDLQYQQHNTTFFLSYLMDTPNNQLESGDHAVQMLEPIYGYGGGFQVDMTNFVDRELNFGVAYGKFYGGEIKDTDSDGKENTFSISNNRLLFQNPFKLSAEMEGFKLRSLPVYFKANWIYDRQQNGSLLSLSARHSPLPQLNVSLGVDLIGVVEETDSPDRKKSFLSQHRADDRMTGALSYAF